MIPCKMYFHVSGNEPISVLLQFFQIISRSNQRRCAFIPNYIPMCTSYRTFGLNTEFELLFYWKYLCNQSRPFYAQVKCLAGQLFWFSSKSNCTLSCYKMMLGDVIAEVNLGRDVWGGLSQTVFLKNVYMFIGYFAFKFKHEINTVPSNKYIILYYLLYIVTIEITTYSNYIYRIRV